MELDTGLETKEEVINKASEIAYKIFKSEKWEYSSGAPSKEELKKTIEHLVSSATGHGQCATGRFIVETSDHEDFSEIRIMLDLGSYTFTKEWD